MGLYSCLHEELMQYLSARRLLNLREPLVVYRPCLRPWNTSGRGGKLGSTLN